MKAHYQDFLQENPNCSGFAENPDAAAIFALLSEDASIIAMLDASNAGKPALSATAMRVEEMMEGRTDPQLSLGDGFTRTVVGRMVKTILAPFGYLPSKQKSFSKQVEAKHFTSAMCYEKTGEATMEIVREIREIPS